MSQSCVNRFFLCLSHIAHIRHFTSFHVASLMPYADLTESLMFLKFCNLIVCKILCRYFYRFHRYRGNKSRLSAVLRRHFLEEMTEYLFQTICKINSFAYSPMIFHKIVIDFVNLSLEILQDFKNLLFLRL